MNRSSSKAEYVSLGFVHYGHYRRTDITAARPSGAYRHKAPDKDDCGPSVSDSYVDIHGEYIPLGTRPGELSGND